jgi:hypothetical protein
MSKDRSDSRPTNVNDNPTHKKPRARREPMEHIAARIPATDVARIDALIAKHKTSWLKPTRSDMIRKLLYKALAAEEAAAGDESDV